MVWSIDSAPHVRWPFWLPNLARSPIRLPPNQDKLIERKRRPMQNASWQEICHRDKKKTIVIHECNHQKLGSTNRNLHGFNMELNKIWATTWYMMETHGYHWGLGGSMTSVLLVGVSILLEHLLGMAPLKKSWLTNLGTSGLKMFV